MTTVSPRALPGTSATDAFTTVDATELYEIDRWGAGYFSIGDNGNVLVHPTKDRARAIDLKQLMDRLQMRGITLPILVRFSDILKHRLGEIHDAFQGAIGQHNYTGKYICVYPIKVNQQRRSSRRCCSSAARTTSASRPAASRS
jgi:arginine decarboxylase